MEALEVIARLKIRPDRLDALNAHIAEILRVTRERDAHTLRCDWFVSGDGAECEVREMFPDEQGLIEHKLNTAEPTVALFRDCVVDHHATLYGEVSDEFLTLLAERAGTAPSVFTFANGLETRACPERGVVGQLE